MFGYIKKKVVIGKIENAIKQLREKQNDILNLKINENEIEEFRESMYKLQGAIYFLELLKNKF